MLKTNSAGTQRQRHLLNGSLERKSSLSEDDDSLVPAIHISPDVLVGRMEQVRLLISDLSKPDSTEEQREMLTRAINLLFHSCFIELSEAKMKTDFDVVH